MGVRSPSVELVVFAFARSVELVQATRHEPIVAGRALEELEELAFLRLVARREQVVDRADEAAANACDAAEGAQLDRL